MAIYAPWLPTLGDQGSHADWKKSQELLSPLDHWIPGFRWLHPHFCCLKSYHISIHPPLIWATSALCCLPANFFLELLQLNSFLCAASTVRFATSSCESPKHKNSIMVKNYLLRSFYQAFSNLQLLQLQSRLPGASQHHSSFAARSRANAFCHRLKTRIAGALYWIDQGSRSADNGDDSALLRECHFFNDFYVSSSSRHSPVHFLPTSSSKSALASWFFNMLKNKLSCRYSPVHIWSRDLISETPGATLPEKETPESVFTTEFTRFQTWWCGWHDDMVDMRWEC